MRLKGKSWFIQLFSIANNYANRKKNQDLMVSENGQDKKVFCFALLWLLPG